MITSISAQISLLSFAIALVAGLAVHNSPQTVLLRALLVMILAGTVGQLAAWSAKAVLRDHLRQRKAQLDRAHLDAMKQIDEAQGMEPVVAAPPAAEARR